MKFLKYLILSLITLGSFMPCFSQISVCASHRTAGENIPPGCLFCTNTVSGHNGGFTAITIPTNFSCGTIENNFFFSIRADSLGEIKLHVNARSCSQQRGLEGVFFDKDFNEVSDCFVAPDGIFPDLIEVVGLTPREYYTLMLDGIEGDICGYDILLRIDIGTYPDFSGVADTIVLPDKDLLTLCQGAEIDFSTSLVAGAQFYDWRYPLFMKSVSGQGNNIRLKTTAPARNPGVLTVVPYVGCSAGESSPSVAIQSGEPIRLTEFFKACSANFPLDYKGLTFSSAFVSQNKTYRSLSGCDSIVTYSPLNTTQPLQILDTAFCTGRTLWMNGVVYDSEGIYEFIGPPSHPFLCDTFIRMNLVETGLIPPEIECTPDTFLNVLSFKWDKVPLADNYRVILNGDTAAIQPEEFFLYTPNHPGERVEIGIEPYNAENCSFAFGTATCFTPDLTGLEDKNRANQIQISPNPSTGIFQISSFFKIEKTEVFDFSGKRILIEKGSEVDLTNYAEGIYIFKIYTEKGVGVRRVFKK